MIERLKKFQGDKKQMSFLDHLEAFRWHILRILIFLCIITAVLFYFSNFIFDTLLFGPTKPEFFTYRALCKISTLLHLGNRLCMDRVNFTLINTDMTGQLMMYIWGIFIAGLIVTLPYGLWEFWRFVRPALYPQELKSAKYFVVAASLLFFMGVSFSYFIIVPWSINFLNNFKISGPTIVNYFSVRSYISTVTTLVVWVGIIFELPVVSYVLTSAGLITPGFLMKYRKHAIVAILIVAALIAPPDVASQIFVSIPLYILFEVSIFVAKYAQHKREIKNSGIKN